MASDGGKGVQRGSELTDNLSTDLSCPICIDYFREPVSLRCGHNFCRECILHAWAWSEHANGSVSCPQCRRQCDRLDVASNRLLARIVEGFQRLCHPDPASPPPSRCQLHQQGLGLFCSDDLQLVCRVCVKSQQHRSHKCTAIGKAYKVCKASSIQLLQKKLKEYRDAQAEAGLKISETLERADRLREQIVAEFAELQRFLQRQQQAVLQSLRESADSAVTQLASNMSLISARCDLIEEALEDIQSTREKTKLLREIKDILQRCDFETEPLPKIPELNLEEFNGPLQYTVWKQMFKIISPVPAHLSLDPESASSDLVLSKDQTTVKGRFKLKDRPYGPRTYPAVPHSQKQFSNYGCVVTREGFTSGKHYWEVNVERMDEWIIGVVKESVNRHDAVPLTPSQGFWTLRKWNGSVYGPEHTCSFDANLRRVGVCVDHQRGQVSFYNGDDMTHLCTATGQFREKIYPFFLPFPQTVTKEALNLFHLKL
ncbi:zinc-binding protein A33-like [Chiloscyllium punctatum]|uniref:zinc-binding protein A33-like n=1 Tax=Chiloscyllium punctatum TaxID=137246 RepID=UPI003B63255F